MGARPAKSRCGSGPRKGQCGKLLPCAPTSLCLLCTSQFRLPVLVRRSPYSGPGSNEKDPGRYGERHLPQSVEAPWHQRILPTYSGGLEESMVVPAMRCSTAGFIYSRPETATIFAIELRQGGNQLLEESGCRRRMCRLASIVYSSKKNNFGPAGGDERSAAVSQ